MSLHNKVAVVTGAGSGIGRAVAKKLAMKGCHVALVDIQQQGLDETLQLLSIYSGKFSVHIVDVTKEEQMAALPQAVIDQHSHIDIIFNNAGTTIDRSFAAHSIKDWQFIINLNLWGVIYGCHYFLPHLLQRPEAYIVNTSSLAGFLGIPTQSSYCVTKAAVKALSESLYAEYKMHNVHVMSVHPGAIKTNIFNAAIEHAEDKEASQKLFALVSKVAMDADKAAAKIVNAMEKKKQRVIVGFDSKIVEVVKRLFPVFIHKVAAWAFKKRG
jgi:hypothetical protein